MQDFQRRKIDLEIWRREHRRNAPADCRCVICAPGLDRRAAMLARIEANRERIGEPPF